MHRRLLLQLRSADRHHALSVGTNRQGRIQDEEMMSAKHGRYSGLRHIAPSRLDYIIRQVQAEGYHVERISSFGIGAVETAVLVEMIRDWANSVQLKVGFNDAHDICVFEAT